MPGNRCGLIIGKGGETIKGLAEQYGVKLVVIQEDDTPMHADKPLRITGEPEKVRACKEAVLGLINGPPGGGGDRGERSDRGGDRGGYRGDRGGPTNDYGSRSNQFNRPGQVTIKVPYEKAGVVIGKGKKNLKLNKIIIFIIKSTLLEPMKISLCNSPSRKSRAKLNYSLKIERSVVSFLN